MQGVGLRAGENEEGCVLWVLSQKTLTWDEFQTNVNFWVDSLLKGLASHRNLTELQMSRVTLSGDGQVIYGPLNFTGDVIFESDVGLEGAIDGVNLLAVKEAWLEFLDETEQDLSRLRWLSSQLCGNIDDLQEIYAGRHILGLAHSK